MKIIKNVLLIVLFAFQCHYVSAQNVETDLEFRILKILQDHHVPGAAVALISKDSLIWKGTFGLADVVNKVPVTDSTLFATGSISKTFVSSAAMIAQEKGLLSINDPLEKLVPSLEYSNQWNNTDPVRLVHLLEHTSGFDEAHFNLFPQADSSTPFSEVMKKSKKSLKTRWRPGNYFEYNTLGFITAAYVIEESVGMPFEDFVEKNLLQPLNMKHATYRLRNTVVSNFSRAYRGNSFEEVPFPDIPQWPAGALSTTIGDMTNFIKMFLTNGHFGDKQVISENSIKQMESPETSLGALAGVQYGYGKGLWGKFERGYLFYGHTGRMGGFLSEFGYSGELNIGYVILINNVDGGKAVKAIKSVLLSSVDKRKNEPVNGAAEFTQLNDIKGCYQPITSVPQLGEMGYFIYRLIDMPIVEEENGQLYQSTMLGDRQALLHVQDLLFKNPDEPMATASFVEDQSGSWQWLTSDASYRQIPMWLGYTQFYMALMCILLIIVGFISLLFWIPVRLTRKKRKNIQLQLFPFLAICSFLGMIASIALFYDPEKMYSLGAVLFLVFGWLFFAFSFLGLIKAVIIIQKKSEVNGWIKYHAILITLACCISASYLLYWDIIGLTLWDY